jgi:hypothetical protein
VTAAAVADRSQQDRTPVAPETPLSTGNGDLGRRLQVWPGT